MTPSHPWWHVDSAPARLPLPPRCAICGTLGHATELYPSTIAADVFNSEVFSARRLPDRVHYRMARCNACGLVRSDPVAPPELHAQLYRAGDFGVAEETANMARTYGRYLARLERHGVRKGCLLEVGCATGFVLEQALDQGYAVTRGVEPSAPMVAAASPRVRPGIVCDIMRHGLFPPNSFDAACLFQTFDHLSHPEEVLDEVRAVLRPGGLLLLLNHNAAAFSAKVMGERSPIIDLQHTYLYSPSTMRRILQARGFEPLEVGGVSNDYRLRYLAHLAPLPRPLKALALAVLDATPLGAIQVSVPLGNLYAIARRPAGA